MEEGIFITNSVLETQKLAENFSKKIKKGDFIALYGDLGSGKTTFVQGVAKGLGITKRILSPTFTIVRQYKIKNQKSKIKNTDQKLKMFYHIDLYRTQTVLDIKSLGMKEILADRNNVVFIEWAEKMQNLLPKERIDIKFEYLEDDKRKITIKIKYQSDLRLEIYE